jgi:hypothetical protein
VTDLPIPVELYETFTTEHNATRITLYMEDGTRLTLDFAPDSEAAVELIELLQRHVNDKLHALGSQGVEITGFVPPEADED